MTGLFKKSYLNQRSLNTMRLGFIQRFTTASQEHYHYEEGCLA